MENLAQLLPRYQRRPSQELAAQIFTALAQAQVYVPVDLDKNGSLPPQQDDAFGLKPDVIPGPGGKTLFPVFSAQSQIENRYGQRFSFLHLSFTAFCRSVLADPNFGGIVVDPFTNKFLLPEEIARAYLISAGGLQ